MARIAKLTFNQVVLVYKELDSFLLRDVLLALPSDVKIVGMGTDYTTATSFINVESSLFKDSLFAYPEIVPIFKRNSSGVMFLDSLDMSAALSTPQPTVAQCQCGVCFHCVTGHPVPTLVSPPPQTQSSGISGWMSNIPSGLGFVGGSLPTPVSAQKPAGCLHSWKTYDSGFSIFDYCEHCNVKKT